MSAGDPAAPLLLARSLAAGYRRLPVLRDVDLAVRTGERWFFVGPNGSGKTTLLRTILGLLRPAAGRIELLLSRERVGFVPQRCDLNPSLPTTLGEFVRLGAVGLSLGAEEIRRRLGGALAEVGLPALEEADYWSLSGGQRQRALVARALVRRPALLILDEPTNGLDLAAEETLLGFLDRVNREEGLALIFVTHDLRIAARHATHVALFSSGGVTAGRRENVLTEDNVSRAYGVEVHVAAGRILETVRTEPTT